VEQLPDEADYVDQAGHAWFVMGKYDKAWPLFERAVNLKPNAEIFQAHKAACAVFLGKTDVARSIYTRILKRNPKNQRIHYELAQLERAKNDIHVKQMLKAVRNGKPSENIFLYLVTRSRQFRDTTFAKMSRSSMRSLRPVTSGGYRIAPRQRKRNRLRFSSLACRGPGQR
jgi:tetratricopeptide (TPR) repeat protein